MPHDRLQVITREGFMRPTYDELLQYLEDRVRERLRDDLNTDEHTIAGKIIRILAYDYAYIYEVMEAVYFGRFPHHAEGMMLDCLMPFAGIIRNPPVPAEYAIRVYGELGTVVEANELQISTSVGDVIFENEDIFTIDSGVDGEYFADCPFVCTQRGIVGNLPENALTAIISVDSRITRVEQKEQLVIGKGKESDYELRRRFDAAVKGVGSGTMPAVIGEVMKVPNVLGVVIEENDTDALVGNLPAHSFHTFVQHEAANDYAIASAILAKKPVGIKAYGEINIQVIDSYGNTHSIGFSMVKPIKLKVRVTVSVLPDEYSGNDTVAANIADYINAFPNGRDIVFTSLYPKAYTVAGVMDVPQLAISPDGGATWVETNIPVDAEHVAKLAAQDVEVTSVQYTDT